MLSPIWRTYPRCCNPSAVQKIVVKYKRPSQCKFRLHVGPEKHLEKNLHLNIRRPTNGRMSSVESFVTKHLELLQLEQDEEVEANKELLSTLSLAALQRRGLCIEKLRISGYRTGLYGRCICTFEPHRPGNTLPSHHFTSGDIAGVWISSDGKRDVISSGIVSHLSGSTLHIAFDGSFESLGLDESETYCLFKMANNVTYERMKRALSNLNGRYSSGQTSRLINVLFGELPPSEPIGDKESLPSKFFNETLNVAQQEAVHFALCQREVAVIHGPPGTGKTTTVVETVLQAISQGTKAKRFFHL